MKKWILGIWLGLCACVVCGLAGVKNASYVQDSSEYVSFGIDIHDIDKVIESNAASLLDSQYARTLQGKRLLAIADIANETSEAIDIELMARKLARALRKSGKFTLTNAIAGSGAKADRFIKDSRKLTKDPNYNQYTTHEQDTLQAPDLSLSGKITQRSKKIGEVVRFDYVFLLTLSDIKTGRVVWDHEKIISKVADPSVLSEIEQQNKAKQREKELQNQARQREKERQAKARQREQELQALRSKCQGGDGEMCVALAEKGDIEWLKSACEKQVGYACWAAGEYYEKKNDVKQSMLWYQKGCDVGDMPSCLVSGFLYKKAKNHSQAFRFYAKACDGGVMEACYNLGALYQKGLGVKQDGAKALEFYTKACDGGVGKGTGCLRLGEFYYFGRLGVSKDFVKARNYYTKGCELDNASACFNLAIMYEEGEGGVENSERAFDLYGKACDLDYGEGCSGFGFIMFYKKQQYAEARKFLEKGCRLDSGLACFGLALSYETGSGARQDFAKAKELAGKACDLGIQQGCEVYKNLRDAGY